MSSPSSGIPWTDEIPPPRIARGRLPAPISTDDRASRAQCRGQVLSRYSLNVAVRQDGATGIAPEQDACDPADWAWEFLRRNPGYRAQWRAAVPRHLPYLTLSDGTQLLRLRRRFPRAEQWGLYAFADPSKPARRAPVFWLPAATRRVVRARCVMPKPRPDAVPSGLAGFSRVQRLAVIGADNIPVVTLKGHGACVSVELHGLAVLTKPCDLVFELDGLEDLNNQTDCLKLLQRFTQPVADGTLRSPFASDNRLRHTLIALDESMAGKTYRQIAIAIFGEQRVAEDWTGASQFLKDRTRRLVARGRELMTGGYRDLLR